MILCINFNIKMKRINNPTAKRCMANKREREREMEFWGNCSVVDKIAVRVEVHPYMFMLET